MISLTFDDALEQHLDHAIPILDKHGLRATFYTHLSARSLSARFEDWRAAARIGHELGNHTIFHPAVESKSWVRAGNALERYFPDRMRLEVEVANQWLDALDGGKPRTFAYPCSNPVLGRPGMLYRNLAKLGRGGAGLAMRVEKLGLDWGASKRSYAADVAPLFLAIRAGGLQIDGIAPATASLDRLRLPSAAVENHSFAQMKGFVERGLKNSGWPILQFHGIQGGHHMDCDLSEFRALVRWLAENHAGQVLTVAAGAASLWPPGSRVGN